MHDTLKLISIQHELGMAIGLDIHLKPMLKEFIQVALKRLGLSGVDFYFHSKIVENPTSLNRSGRKLSHILSVPELDTYKALKPTINLNKIFEKLQNADEWHEIYNKTTQSYVYFFNLADIGLIILFILYGVVENADIAAALYVIDHLFFALAIAIKTYFQKIALPEDIAASAGVSFSINHIAAVVIPALLGMVWIVNSSWVFYIGAGFASCSLLLTLLMPFAPGLNMEFRHKEKALAGQVL